MNCSEKLNDWPSVAGAIEKMFLIAPVKKKFYEYDYGMALYKMNRFEEAIPHLKAALATADIPPPPFKPLQVKTDEEGGGAVIPTIAPPTGTSSTGANTNVASASSNSQAGKTLREDLSGVDSTSGETQAQVASHLLSYDNAIRSECIVIAEYRGCEKAENIRYNSPPRTAFHITEILKGPPLNKDLPVRYAFHTPFNGDPPENWKFDEKTMLPEKGSKWILFIEFAVPERLQFNTYMGSYGRQPATEANLDKLDKLLESHNMKFLQSTH
jgi:hypothetical protein